MMLRGVTAGRALADNTLLVDIGGGSTELVLRSNGDALPSTSLDVGCVRITERFLASDPPTRSELASAAASSARSFPATKRSVIGVAGTVTTLATLDLGTPSTTPSGRTDTASRSRRSSASSGVLPR